MKIIFFLLLTFLVGCTSDSTAPVQAGNEQLAGPGEVITSRAVVNHEYTLQDQVIYVTRLTIKNDRLESKALYLIRTPFQELSFRISDRGREFHEGLSGEELQLVKDSVSEATQKFDFAIDSLIAEYAVRNVLNTDRCRQVSVRPEILSVLQAPRAILYFGTGLLANVALKWDTIAQRFQGFVATGEILDIGRAGEEELLLTPNDNVQDTNGKFFADNMFISADNFNYSCDSQYDYIQSTKTKFQAEADEEFLPLYNSNLDPQFSSYIDAHPDGTIMFYRNASIYQNYPLKISGSLLAYAKNLPLYKQFIGASK